MRKEKKTHSQFTQLQRVIARRATSLVRIKLHAHDIQGGEEGGGYRCKQTQDESAGEEEDARDTECTRHGGEKEEDIFTDRSSGLYTKVDGARLSP